MALRAPTGSPARLRLRGPVTLAQQLQYITRQLYVMAAENARLRVALGGRNQELIALGLEVAHLRVLLDGQQRRAANEALLLSVYRQVHS
jgi:hypothetical protein